MGGVRLDISSKNKYGVGVDTQGSTTVVFFYMAGEATKVLLRTAKHSLTDGDRLNYCHHSISYKLANATDALSNNIWILPPPHLLPVTFADDLKFMFETD